MKEFVAVNAPITFAISRETYPLPDISFLKREALMFDRIAIPKYKETFIENTRLHDKFPEVIQELEWLFEKGIIFEPESTKGVNISNEEYRTYSESGKQHAKELMSLFIGFNVDEAADDDVKKLMIQERLANISKLSTDEVFSFILSEDFRKLTELMTSSVARTISIELRELKNIDAYPVFRRNIPVSQTTPASKDIVVEITLNALPVPDDLTSWEHIHDFRDDPDGRHKFLKLRDWMSDVVREQLKPTEVEDKLETLISDYKEHMKLHKIKTRLDTLKTIVLAEAGFITGGWLSGLGALPGIVGMVATPLYSIKQRNISLLEEERKAPGNEVAYIIKARESFT